MGCLRALPLYVPPLSVLYAPFVRLTRAWVARRGRGAPSPPGVSPLKPPFAAREGALCRTSSTERGTAICGRHRRRGRGV